jgi:exodeoxyribonuclease V alpha subunit
VRRQEVEIAKVLEGIAKVDLPQPAPDWRALLTRPKDKGGFGEPKTPRENEAIEEKVRALEVLFNNRITILTGSAGTGKTSVLSVFLDELRKLEGHTPTLLAAPTGKARVRLRTSTQRGSEDHSPSPLEGRHARPEIPHFRRADERKDTIYERGH